MGKRDSVQLGYQIWKTKDQIFARDGYLCQHPRCLVMGADNLQLCHIIGQGAGERRWVKNKIAELFNVDLREGQIDRIIHHPFNLRTGCAKHNDYFNIGCKPVQRKALLVKIYTAITEEDHD